MTKAQQAAKRYRMEQWSKAITERVRSGQSVAEWCEEKGVSERVYYYRLVQVRNYTAQLMEMSKADAITIGEFGLEKQEKHAPSAFTEVKVLAAPIEPVIPGTADTPHYCNQLRVELGQLRLSVDSTYPAEKLTVLLRELMRP